MSEGQEDMKVLTDVPGIEKGKDGSYREQIIELVERHLGGWAEHCSKISRRSTGSNRKNEVTNTKRRHSLTKAAVTSTGEKRRKDIHSSHMGTVEKLTRTTHGYLSSRGS